ncbi:MAG: HDOD domain-containing protein [Deltaproteobacteria bacterium]|nr:HDOD domain-containing protein [Deltaproteobacteria bacterium]
MPSLSGGFEIILRRNGYLVREQKIINMLEKWEKDLPAVPQTVSRVLAAVANDFSDVQQLEEIIKSDQSLSSKILRMANSAFYGLTHTVSTVREAIMMLGYGEVKHLALDVSLIGFFGRPKELKGFDINGLWLHSFAVGSAARIIADFIRGLNPEEAFTAGILHDVGKMIFLLAEKDDFLSVIEYADTHRVSFSVAEQEVCGLGHSFIGGILARRWYFPEYLVSCIEYHHRPDLAGIYTPMAAVVALADAVAYKLAIGAAGAPVTDIPDAVLLNQVGLKKQAMKEIMHQMEKQKARVEESMAEVCLHAA